MRIRNLTGWAFMLFLVLCPGLLKAGDYSDDITIEIFDSNGNPVAQGDTVSGTVTGRVTVVNSMMQHFQLYQNFRPLHTIETGHMIDSSPWVRAFTVDTTSFYDGENLISTHVHPMNMPGEIYNTDFKVQVFRIYASNSNPAPNGDTQLPYMTMENDVVQYGFSGSTPGEVISNYTNSITVNDDFGPIDIEHTSSVSRKAQVITHLGSSVLGRFRWLQLTPPFGDSDGRFLEGCDLINFQSDEAYEARMVFFFNDDCGRANYAFHTFNIPALDPADRQDFPLPDLDAVILNAHQGDIIIIPDGGSHTVQVEVRNVNALKDHYSKLSLWVGNRFVDVVDLAPYYAAMNPGETGFIVEAEIPATEIVKLQNSRQGGVDSTAFALWVDLAQTNGRNLASSEHVHLTSIRIRVASQFFR